MPCLSNAQHENAAQHIARRQQLSDEQRLDLGLKADASLREEAAAIGGLDPKGKSFKANARKFCSRTIGKRVAEIQQVAANVAGISVEKLTGEVEEARVGAMHDSDWSAANQCVQTKAKLNGLWRDKVALTDPSGTQAAAPFIVEVVRFGDGAAADKAPA